MTLKQYLTRRQESDEDFAKRSGVSRATIKRIHRAGCARSAAVIEKIVAATDHDVRAIDLLPATRKDAA